MSDNPKFDPDNPPMPDLPPEGEPGQQQGGNFYEQMNRRLTEYRPHAQPGVQQGGCFECGGRMVKSKMSSYTTVRADEGSPFFTRSSTVKALVCTRCGFIKLYATDPSVVE